jgi:tetratricopeptide (TPR) repeat protein
VNFNAKEALNKGIEDLDKKRKDNYLQILPIYYYPPKQDLTSAFPSLDRTIEKSSKSVFKHSILLRGKEFVKTMNKAYLMMGKAYFYKQDYNQAKRVFNYIIATYSDWGSVEEATIWLARCEMQQEYFVRAVPLLEVVAPRMHQSKIKAANIRDDDELTAKEPKTKVKYANKYQKQRAKAKAKAEKAKAKAEAKKSSAKAKAKKTATRKITNEVRRQYYAAEAEYNLLAPNGEIEAAIDNIKLALQYKPKKAFRVRLYFILGQLYEKMGEQAAAQNWFLKVIKSTPEYEMEFSARMHLAVNYDGTPMSKKTIMKELNKMLKDSKNEDFRDQIYFAISEIARIDEDNPDRESNLAKSVAAYTKNDYQRTFSSVTLADIFFQKEEYISAQAYYDTALMSLPQNYPNREGVIKKASILKDLVENLQIIQLQDSLQRIAKMSTGERNNWVNKMIAQYTEEERRLAKEESDRMLALAATQNFANINVNTGGQSGKWYFYNPGLVSQGATEFYRRFGNRKLEDNWRISNKTAISFEDMAEMNLGEKKQEDEFDEDGNPIIKRETDPKKPAYYTQDLPMTQGAIDSSNNLIMNAMYNASIIYYDQLNDLKRSNEMLQKIIQRFPNSDLALPAYFLLWVNYTKLNNIFKANEAKDAILTKYPDTDYAKLILNPNYYKKLAEAEKENEHRYEELYRVFSAKQWERTVQLADELLELTDDVTLTSKTTYLRAVAIGQLQGEEALKDALKQIIKNYPKEEVTELAKIYLSTLATTTQTSKKDEANDDDALSFNYERPAPVVENPFNPNIDEQHHIILLVNVHKKAVNEVKYDVSNFNTTYFSLEHFNINSFYINNDEQLVTVSRFKGKTDAMDYYIALTHNNLFSHLIENKNITVYAISASNYSIFYNKINERHLYKQFFQENYLK